jgi:protein subunit release factor B
MNVTERFDVSQAKLADLMARIERLHIDARQIDEQFVRGGGRGGQKVNKTNNCVVLRYAALGIIVRCQRDRRRTVNRFLALRGLVDEVEMRISPETSARLMENERKRRSHARSRRRAKARSLYNAGQG